jgi:hypothetical protein
MHVATVAVAMAVIDVVCGHGAIITPPSRNAVDRHLPEFSSNRNNQQVSHHPTLLASFPAHSSLLVVYCQQQHPPSPLSAIEHFGKDPMAQVTYSLQVYPTTHCMQS